MTSSLSWPSKWIDQFSGLHIRPFDLRTHDFVYEGAKEGHHGCFPFMDDRMKVQFVSRKGNTTAFHRLQIDLISQWVKVQHKYRKAWQSFLCTRRSTNKEKVVGLHCIGPYSVPRWEIPVGWKQCARFLVLSRKEAEDTTRQCQLKKPTWLGHALKFLHKVQVFHQRPWPWPIFQHESCPQTSVSSLRVWVLLLEQTNQKNIPLSVNSPQGVFLSAVWMDNCQPRMRWCKVLP